ncbi:MAG: heparinase II/III family protein, partial [Propionibacteriaceae bacterium]|nr:heparinase II/III family protein [Propionibacteriaceae bacterium]
MTYRPFAAAVDPNQVTVPADAVWRAPATALALPPAADRAVWSAERLDAPTLAAVRGQAQAALCQPWPQPLAHAAARFHRDGDRVEYESAVFARQRRLTAAAVMAAVERDGPGADTWLDEVADGLILLCEQSSWCWPAHDDTWQRHGAVLPTTADPFVDLGAAEVVAQLAYADHLLGPDLDRRYPGLTARLRREAAQRVFEPFANRRDWHWLGLAGPVHNWNPWIHGHLLAGALRLVDDAGRRAHLVGLCVEGLTRYLAALPPDGAVDEGFAYWWHGAARALEALALLAAASDGAVDGFALPAVRATVKFPGQMALGGGWYVNYADGPARPHGETCWHVLFAAARRVQDDDAAAHALAQRRPGRPLAEVADSLPRLLRALADPDWSRRGPEAPGEPLPRDVWLPSTQVFLARPAAGTAAGLTLSAKGGHNGENHNHLDIGAVIVASDGVPVVADPGRPTYTAQTFGPDRYAIWTMRSDWHSVPEVAGAGQGVGSAYAAARPAVRCDGPVSQFALDLQGASPTAALAEWRRRVSLDRAAGTVRVDDRGAWAAAAPAAADSADPAGPAAAPAPADQALARPDGPAGPAATSPAPADQALARPDAPADEPAQAPAAPRARLRWILAGDVVGHGPGWAAVQPLDGAPAVRLEWTPPVAGDLDGRPLDEPMLTAVWGPCLHRLTLAPPDDPADAAGGR